MAWYEEYLQANTPINTPTSGSKKVSKRWQAPTGETLKLNVDGAFLPNVPFGGTGGVLRNAQGRFLAAFSRRMNFVSSPLHAELLALKTGIELMQAIDVTNAVIESDCLMAVQAVNSLSCDLSSLRALVADIKGLLDGYADMCIIFAPRQANVIAHRLASLSFESDVHLEWFVNAPELILDALMYDLTRIQ